MNTTTMKLLAGAWGCSAVAWISWALDLPGWLLPLAGGLSLAILSLSAPIARAQKLTEPQP